MRFVAVVTWLPTHRLCTLEPAYARMRAPRCVHSVHELRSAKMFEHIIETSTDDAYGEYGEPIDIDDDLKRMVRGVGVWWARVSEGRVTQSSHSCGGGCRRFVT